MSKAADILANAEQPRALPAALPTSITSVQFSGAISEPGLRSVPVEIGVEIVFGGIPFATMMLTPCDLEDFAFGFSLTEGVIADASELRSVQTEWNATGAKILLDIAPVRLQAHLSRRRAMTGRTSCGICGSEKISVTPPLKLRGSPIAVELQAIKRALAELEQKQALNHATHAVHAAGWADRNGHIGLLREDVGRHNALDKLIGALIRQKADPLQGFVVITSRCSFEMVEKAAAFGAGILVAISAPTSLAVERARAHDITLVGIARSDSLAVFNGQERIISGEPRS